MNQQLFHLQEWTPAVTSTADGLIAQICHVAPDLEVLFMGAAALQLPGKNDIDLDILCKQSELAHYTELLSSVLGKPKETNDKLTAWSFVRDGYEIDCILSDPQNSHVPRQKKVFEMLKNDETLRSKYEALKREWDGLPHEQYEQHKKEFFSTLLDGNIGMNR